MNPPTTSQRTVVKPRTDLLSSQSSSLKEAIEPLSKSRAGKSTYTLDFKLLYDKLCALKRHQDESERSDSQFTQCLNDKLSSAQAQARVLPIEDDDQAILDQHVSRVFSPYLSPGNASPKHLHRYQQRANEMSTSMPNFGKTIYEATNWFDLIDFCVFHIVSQALRQSRSIPEHASSAMFYGASKTTRMNKWSSQNIDSGISLYSADIPYNKDKEVKPKYVNTQIASFSFKLNQIFYIFAVNRWLMKRCADWRKMNRDEYANKCHAQHKRWAIQQIKCRQLQAITQTHWHEPERMKRHDNGPIRAKIIYLHIIHLKMKRFHIEFEYRADKSHWSSLKRVYRKKETFGKSAEKFISFLFFIFNLKLTKFCIYFV